MNKEVPPTFLLIGDASLHKEDHRKIGSMGSIMGAPDEGLLHPQKHWEGKDLLSKKPSKLDFFKSCPATSFRLLERLPLFHTQQREIWPLRVLRVWRCYTSQ